LRFLDFSNAKRIIKKKKYQTLEDLQIHPMLFFRESRRNSCAFVCIQLLLQDVFLSPANKAEVKKKKKIVGASVPLFIYTSPATF